MQSNVNKEEVLKPGDIWKPMAADITALPCMKAGLMHCTNMFIV